MDPNGSGLKSFLKTRLSPPQPSIPYASSRSRNNSASGATSDGRVWEPDYSGKYNRKTSQVDGNTHRNTPPTDGNFDPYQHRNVKFPINNFGSIQHTVKGSVGFGVLVMPLGFYYTGFVVGTLGTVLVGCIVSYGMNLMIRTEILLCKRKRVEYLTYGQAMQYAMEEGPDWMIGWSKHSRLVVNIVMVLTQVSFCSIYVISVGRNLKSVIDDFNCEMFSLRWLICTIYLAVILVNYVPNLQVYAYFSTLANVMMYTSFVWIMYYIFTQETSPGPRTYIGQPQEWVSFIGICMFGMQAVGVHSTVEAYMKRPQDFLGFFGVLNLSMIFITATFWIVGFCGYWVYGGDTGASLMSHLPDNSTMAQSLHILHALAMLISFRLNSFPVIDIIWNEFIVSKLERMTQKKQTYYHYALLTGFSVFVFLLTLSIIDFVGPISMIFGFLEGSMLVVGFPAIMELCNLWPDNFGRHSWIFYKDLGLFGLSLIVLSMGCYVTVIEIMNPPPAAVSCAIRNRSY